MLWATGLIELATFVALLLVAASASSPAFPGRQPAGRDRRYRLTPPRVPLFDPS
jgi:hypothetical protein